VHWSNYPLWRSGLRVPPAEAPRAEARAEFARVMASKDERIDRLRELLIANDSDLDASDHGIQRLNDWFASDVEPSEERPGFLTSRWYSVSHDIAMFLGDVMIDRNPELSWSMHRWAPSSASFQRAVLTGFKLKGRETHQCEDIEVAVTTYGHRLIASRGSARTYAPVLVRGVEIDIEELSALARQKPVEADAFVRFLRVVAARVARGNSE
jgi:hypothetical protein